MAHLRLRAARVIAFQGIAIARGRETLGLLEGLSEPGEDRA